MENRVFSVIPAKAGIQFRKQDITLRDILLFEFLRIKMDSRFRGNDNMRISMPS